MLTVMQYTGEMDPIGLKNLVDIPRYKHSIMKLNWPLKETQSEYV